MRLITTLLFTILTTSLFSYPIDPCPLRQLIKESEHIVYGQIKVIQESKNDGLFGPYSVAVMRIQKVLQGEIDTNFAEIGFQHTMICPEPAHYEKDKWYLAFINKNKETGEYSTHALSYGSKQLTKTQFEIYKNRIEEYQKILLLKDSILIQNQTLNWLVKCAIDSATRWEGVYELGGYSDFMKSFLAEHKAVAVKDILSVSQLAQLRAALISTNDLQPIDMGLLRILNPESDSELLKFLVEKSKQRSEYAPLYWNTVLKTIAQLSDRAELVDIIDEIKELKFYIKEERIQIQALQKQFIAKL